MKKYECMYITDVQLAEDEKSKLTELIKTIIKDNGGEPLEVQDLGVRYLAYVIKKRNSGNYWLVTFNGEAKTIAELQQRLNYDDRLLKYMITLISH